MVRRHLLSRSGAAVLLAAVLGVSACGFQPMHARPEAGQAAGVADRLSAVAVAPIPDRIGQILRGELEERLTPSGPSARSRYVLAVSLNRSIEEQAFRRDDTATRARLLLVASYTLSEGDQVVYRGTSRATVPYNILEARYATITAQRDAEQRAARLIADDIRTRLSVRLAQP